MANGALQMFRWVGYAEGTSFLVLLGIAMPIKYLVHVPEVVRVVRIRTGERDEAAV